MHNITTTWDLTPLYKGLDDPAYEADILEYQEKYKELESILKKAGESAESQTFDASVKIVEDILLIKEKTSSLFRKLMDYVQLRQTVNMEDGQIMAQINRLMGIYAENAQIEVASDKYLGLLDNTSALEGKSPIIGEYHFYLNYLKEKAAHTLTEAEEAIASAMDMTGGAAWGNLQSFLTSTVKVDYKGEILTLSEIRNLAYSPDAEVRKAAYEAEMASYEQIADGVAFALNNIKNQVTMLSRKRGFASPLDETLFQSRMSRQTLDAMMDAIRDYLPILRKYLLSKAEKLGYSNGLPFYDLFAPLGNSSTTFTPEEAGEYLIRCFGEFAPDMADMMTEAFENRWIDFYPAKGKTDGAFCAAISAIKQSRILTNYANNFSSVDTLAHELGHAYHDRQIQEQRPLNWEYPMPVAETASTFNEIYLCNWTLKQASQEEKLAILESDLCGQIQCVIDIYSRYLFEKAVFEQSKDKFLMKDDLKKLMLWAQNEAYGEGLNPEFMHPYMWICKSHYYSSQLSFYNFPYAFGNLFAMGLYSMYCREGKAFVDRYKKMLAATVISTVEEDGHLMGVDLTKQDFWRESLQMLADEIEEFISIS